MATRVKAVYIIQRGADLPAEHDDDDDDDCVALRAAMVVYIKPRY